MKKIFIILIFIISIVVFSNTSICETCYAKSEIEEQLEKEVDENLSKLFNENLDSFVTDFSNGSTSLKDIVKSIIAGKNPITLDGILGKIFELLRDGIKSSLLSLVYILALSLLSGFSSSLTAGFKKEGTKQVIHLAIYGSIILTLILLIGDLIKTVVDTINSLQHIIDTIFPIFITLFSVLNSSASLSIVQPLTMIFSNIVFKIIINVVIPLFFATIIFTFVGNMTDTIKLEKLTKTFKSIGNWVMGIMFSVLTTFVSMQGIVGASIDTITIKSAKFALSTYVPILGGYLSDGFDIVLASCVLIKNALGFAVFTILLLVIISPIVRLLCTSLSLKLVSSFVEPVTDPKISSLLFNTGTNLNLLITCLAGISFLMFIFIIIIVCSFNGGVV